MESQLNNARKRLSEVEDELADNQKVTAEQMKELEAQLREATGGEPGANVTRMMGEFTETMGQPAQSDGNLYAAMKEYEDKLTAAEQENAALRAKLGSLGR